MYNTFLGLNPRFVGQVFRLKVFAEKMAKKGLNPRFVGQVFRLNLGGEVEFLEASLNPRFVGQVFRPFSSTVLSIFLKS